MERWQLAQRQALPLEAKIELSKLRIREWYEHWEGQVYVAFSGGKDSTVLLDLVRQMYPDVPAVFCNTGMEYPEICRFVKTIPNLITVRPAMTFKRVIEGYGYPVISKQQAAYIEEWRTTRSAKLRAKRWNGNAQGFYKISEQWKFLVHAPFKISDRCCQIMKKQPFERFEETSGLKMLTGEMATDSEVRREQYLLHGCNAFDLKRPKSMPLGFWTERDIWAYIRSRKIPYSSIYDMGYERTGCVFCMFGVHLEKPENRFQRLYRTHPKLYRYCMEQLGIAEVLDYMKIPRIPERGLFDAA